MINQKPLVIATGSNLGDRLGNLYEAARLISLQFKLVAMSRVYSSKAVDFLDQPEFLNQVLQFQDPGVPAEEILDALLGIELQMGRRRDIPKGPRTIDIDLLFLGDEKIETNSLQLPHPRLFVRSFVVRPLMELPCYPRLQEKFTFIDSFDNDASPLS